MHQVAHSEAISVRAKIEFPEEVTLSSFRDGLLKQEITTSSKIKPQ